MVHVCGPSAGEAETGGSSCWLAGHQNKREADKGPLAMEELHLRFTTGFQIPMHTYAHAFPCMHKDIQKKRRRRHGA